MTDVSFGEWLKRQRRILGWTQKELAIRVNCSISAVRKIEAEERHPSAQVVNRLAEIFDIPPHERRDFLRFARGDWQAVSPKEIEEATLRVLNFDPRSNLPQPRMSFMGNDEVNDLLHFAWDSPDVSEKLALIHRALEMSESSGDTRGQLESLWQLGWLDQRNRFFHWEKALALARLLGDAHTLASGLSIVGFFLVLNGKLDEAQKVLVESNTLHHQLHLKPVTSHLLSAYGQISLIRGDYGKARAYLQEHARASLETGNRQDYLWSHVRMGYVALREGSLEEASRIFRECIREFKKDRNTIGVVFALEGLAALDIQEEHASHAARLIGWADSTREKISDTRPLLEQADVDKIIAACIAKMGAAAFSDAHEDGRKMTLDKAVTFALDENNPKPMKRIGKLHRDK